MCQAIANGGRRCPRHRRDTLVAIRLATQDSQYITASMAAEIFNELRREGRHITSIGRDPDEIIHQQMLRDMTYRLDDLEDEVPARYADMLRDAEDSEETPDTATLYALRALNRTVEERDAALSSHLGHIANNNGYTDHQVRLMFMEERARIAPDDERMTQEMHTQAFYNSLPTDTASVLALQALSTRDDADRMPAITMREVPEEPRQLHQIHAVGYNRETRQLGVTYATSPDTVSYYRNVPEALGDNLELLAEHRATSWGQLSTSGEEMSVDQVATHALASLRALPSAHQYATAEEAREATTLIRCAACGQFASPVAAPPHSCPQLRAARARERGEGTPASAPFAAPVAIPADTIPVTREVTAESQVNPLPLRLRSVAEEFPVTINGNNYSMYDAATRGRLMNRLEGFSPEDQDTIRNATRDTAFVFAATRGLMRGRATRSIVRSYDVREYAMETGPHYARPEVANVVRDATLVRRGYVDMRSYDSPPAPAPIHSDFQLEMEAYPTPARYADGTNDATDLQWVARSDFEGIYAENPTATIQAPVEWSGRLQGGVDEYGYDVSSTAFTVTGDLAVSRDENGVFSPASSTTNLQCTCPLYRRHYHCAHVDYVRHHSVNVASDRMLAYERDGAERGSSPRRLAGIHEGLSFQLDENGHGVAAFARPSRENGYSTYYLDTAVIPTPSEIQEDFEAAQDSLLLAESEMDRTPDTALLYQAYQASSRVRFPLHVTFPNSNTHRGRQRATVQGTAEIYRNVDGEPVLDAERLRCSCGRFTSSDSPCEHVATLVTNSSHFVTPQDASTAASGENERELSTSQPPWQRQREVNSARQMVREEGVIQTRMRVDNLTRDEAVAAIAAEVEEEARLRREAQLREREEEVERQRAQIEATRRQYAESPEGQAYAMYRETQRELWENPDPATTVEETRALLEASASDRAARRDRRTFSTENVTDGVCDPNTPGSRRFGVELEFILPEGEDYYGNRTTLNAIALDLQEAGLSENNRVRGYHAGQMENWQSWSLEEDATVSGELVSPLLSDSPEDWEQLSTAIDILKSHGATVNAQAGSHVHVSTGSYGDSLASHIELVREMHRHEDILYRAAANPARGTHRGGTWCSPNVDTPESAILPSESARWGAYPLHDQMIHETALNMSATGDGPSSHAEFRLWDGSLSVETIQRQVAISVAMTETAERNVTRNGGVSQPLAADERTDRGTFYEGDGREMTDEAVENLTRFLNSNFRRQQDREQFVLLMERNRFAS